MGALRIFGVMLLCLCAPWSRAADVAPIRPNTPLTFPRDHGAHPDTRTEWWYVTGQVETDSGAKLGVQITFFRSRTGIDAAPGRFAPTQLYFAHAAIADPRHGKLRHDQRAARGQPGLVEASTATTDVRIDHWRFRRDGDRYLANIRSSEFTLDLGFTITQPILLQGDAGFSRKGNELRHASHYYSFPHLKVDGSVTLAGKSERVRGSAWLDHEWSSEILMPGAVGWDWVGINLDDGGALMAFRIRDKAGQSLWTGGTLRAADGRVRKFGPDDITFTANATWRSPATGAVYPVDANIRVGDLTFRVQPVMPDQELDSRASTGAIYWEGAVNVLREGKRVGAGYLEMTGYAERIRF